MSGFCWNKYDHERQAKRDHDRGRCDRDMYERHSFDACKEAYTDEWDRQERRDENRRYEQMLEDEAEQRRIDRAERERVWQRQQAQAEYEEQMQYEDEMRAQQESDAKPTHQEPTP